MAVTLDRDNRLMGGWEAGWADLLLSSSFTGRI
jgi:hypothetical protein